MATVYLRRIFTLISLLLALLVLYSWSKNGVNTEYVVVALVVILVYLVTPRLVAEFRLRRIRKHMNGSGSVTEYDVRYRTINVTSHLNSVQFYEEDHQVAMWEDGLNLEGKKFSIVNDDGVSSLVSHGQVIATSRKDERRRYTRHIAGSELRFTLVSLNIGVFPFAVYQDDREIGYVRTNLVVCPRSIPLELQIFSYISALKLYNIAMSRRDSRVGM